jgi:uncharacterized protein (TIGR03790 family)
VLVNLERVCSRGVIDGGDFSLPKAADGNRVNRRPKRIMSTMKRRISVLMTTVAVLLSVAPSAHAQSAENVAVVINESSPDSIEVGEYYARKRALPASNVIRIRTSTNEEVDRGTYLTTIELTIARTLASRGLQDRVLYVVLTKGVPLRIAGTQGTTGTVASVDSELTLSYRRAVGTPIDARAGIPNPYFLNTKPISEAKPFTHRDRDIYLVTRLDGYTVADAKALVDRAMSPATDGQIVLDQQDKLINRTGEDWLENAAKRLEAGGFGKRILLESTVKGVRDVKPVLGYYSWGSNDPRNRVRSFGLGFVPGAIAGMFVSTDARTFREPPKDWVPTDDDDKTKWFAGTGQSLIGDLVREGVTGVAGHVSEPMLAATVRPDVLFPAYLAGFNLAEAYYLAMPMISWQNVVLGDPLCAPFRRRTLSRAEIEEGIDAATQSPSLFAARRLAQLKTTSPGLPVRALQLMIKAEMLSARGDQAGERAALEEATRVAPNAAQAQLQLALMFYQQQNFPAAIERYRRVVALQPRNASALNNLAFLLVVANNAPSEALPFAKQAVEVSPQNPAAIDTLAWIEYLTGDLASASKRIALAIQGAPNVADIRIHAATIYAAAGARAVAEDQLREALRLQPSLESSPAVKQIRAKLEELAKSAK